MRKTVPQRINGIYSLFPRRTIKSVVLSRFSKLKKYPDSTKNAGTPTMYAKLDKKVGAAE